jgi:NhaP-type Na+/H+ or K+/H+ antiporter
MGFFVHLARNHVQRIESVLSSDWSWIPGSIILVITIYLLTSISVVVPSFIISHLLKKSQEAKKEINKAEVRKKSDNFS